MNKALKNDENAFICRCLSTSNTGIPTGDLQLRSWLTHFAGRKTLPYVFVDRRPVGGFGEIRALERSAQLEHLVRGDV